MLERTTFFVREHIGFMKLTDTYDILDPETQEQIGIAREKPGGLLTVLRLFVNKQLLPTKVFVYEGPNPDDESKLLFSIQRGFTLFRPRVNICDKNGNVVGWFKSKLFTIGATFRVFDAAGNEVALVKGDWKGWNFRFLDNSENELGTVTKKWAGIGKELFTSADNYMIALNGEPDQAKAMLLLAAGLAVDTVYKEKQ
ncbi:MAG: oxidoreductase [Kiritimatiellae bacterium]|nr:oxidoreductase [Kiritimatiellia bacterium]